MKGINEARNPVAAHLRVRSRRMKKRMAGIALKFVKVSPIEWSLWCRKRSHDCHLLKENAHRPTSMLAQFFFAAMVLHMRDFKTNHCSPLFAFTLQQEVTLVRPELVAFTLRKFDPGYIS